MPEQTIQEFLQAGSKAAENFDTDGLKPAKTAPFQESERGQWYLFFSQWQQSRWLVPAEKQAAVIAADVPALLEEDENYFGFSFIDERTDATSPDLYQCRPSLQTDGSTIYKWIRTAIF